MRLRYSIGPRGIGARYRASRDISSSYVADGDARRAWTDAEVVLVAVAAWVGALLGSPVPVPIGVASVSIAIVRRGALGAACGTLLLASGLAWRSLDGLRPPAPGPVAGTAELLSDPAPRGSGVSVLVRIGQRRYVIDGYGTAARRLRHRQAGDLVWVTGRVVRLSATESSRLRAQHVVARIDPGQITDLRSASALARASNRLKELFTRSSAHMPADEQALFMGLVIGDDRNEPPPMVAAFRRTGLSHLTAASGQNVAFLLLVTAPLLRRLRPTSRWLASLGVIAWFAVLTRFEPSVIRAAVMAALSATAFWRGWSASPLRLLALAVTACLLIDPLLVWSVGWQLSVGATAGISLLARPLADRMPGPRWLAESIGVALAAQIGVMPVELLVFGSVPAVSLPANLLAVPVAGMVMAWGIVAGVVGGSLPIVAPVVQLPSVIGVRWVIAVVRLAARLEPGWPPWFGAGLHVLVIGSVLARRNRASVVGPR